MPDPLMIHGLTGPKPVSPISPAKPAAGQSVDGKSFSDLLMDSLNQVNQLQQEAEKGVEKVATGEADNLAEVFSAVRKADVAFSMLMEMRNKLVDAYREIQQMRV